MAYQFLDAYGSVLTADSSIVSGSGLTGTQRPIINIGSIIGGTLSLTPTSVAALQATNPWITQVVSSVNSTTYLQRNDTVASALGVDLTYRPGASDSAGRLLIKPFAPNEASIFGISSTVNAGDAASVVAVAAAGAGLRNYLTDILVVNTGSVASSITFTEGGGSILGRTIAPATGGSNIIGMHAPIRNQVPNQPINIVVGTASSVISVTVLGHKAP